jgi:alkaline phosphatase D
MRAALASLPLSLPLALAFGASSLAAQDEKVLAGPGDFLAGYNAVLEREIELPVMPKGAVLDADRALTRIAFGSCNHQLRSQHMWGEIAANDPDLFLFIGDNNYGDQGWAGDASLGTLRAAYAVQARTPELTNFRGQVPMMVTWDDHDFGFNDGGANFAFRELSESIFETFWGASPEVRSRPGIYDSRMIGEAGKRTQIIMLDTRFFRSNLDRMPYQAERPPLGPYVPSLDTARTMLGDAQWQWLEGELAKPADLRILVSSIQVITDAHNYESWEALPLERAKLYELLSAREESGLVILSGDRHAGGIYSDSPRLSGLQSGPQSGPQSNQGRPGKETFWELTSSSLNYSFSSTERNTAREPDPKRLTDFISEENFGTVDIDWRRKEFTLRLIGNKADVRAERTVRWDD